MGADVRPVLKLGRYLVRHVRGWVVFQEGVEGVDVVGGQAVGM